MQISKLIQVTIASILFWFPLLFILLSCIYCVDNKIEKDRKMEKRKENVWQNKKLNHTIKYANNPRDLSNIRYRDYESPVQRQIPCQKIKYQ